MTKTIEKQEVEKVSDLKIARNLSGGYYYPQALHHYRRGGVDLVIGWADGINAGGLIGTEHCGLFIVDQGRMSVVMDCVRQGIDALASADRKYHAVRRLTEMAPRELSEFMEASGRMRYNPFTIEQIETDEKKVMARKDAKIRNDFPKSQLTTQFERFVVARIALGPDGGRKFFKNSIYKMLSLYGGHIAHYNISGFYEEQMKDSRDFTDNLETLSNGLTTFGMPINRDRVPEIPALMAIAKYYLQKLRDLT